MEDGDTATRLHLKKNNDHKSVLSHHKCFVVKHLLKVTFLLLLKYAEAIFTANEEVHINSKQHAKKQLLH